MSGVTRSTAWTGFAMERTGNQDDDLIAGLSILCHDFGKPSTTTTDYGRITSRGHEPEGEAPTRRFLERLTKQDDLINGVIPLVLCHLRPRALHDANASDSAVRRLASQVKRIDRLVRVARAARQNPLTDFLPAPGCWNVRVDWKMKTRPPPRSSWVAICWNWESSQALIWDGCSMNVTKLN
jgi:hypothetical protein